MSMSSSLLLGPSPPSSLSLYTISSSYTLRSQASAGGPSTCLHRLSCFCHSDRSLQCVPRRSTNCDDLPQLNTGASATRLHLGSSVCPSDGHAPLGSLHFSNSDELSLPTTGDSATVVPLREAFTSLASFGSLCLGPGFTGFVNPDRTAFLLRDFFADTFDVDDFVVCEGRVHGLFLTPESNTSLFQSCLPGVSPVELFALGASSLVRHSRLAASSPSNLNRFSHFTSSRHSSFALIGASDPRCPLRGLRMAAFLHSRFPFPWLVLLRMELGRFSNGSLTHSTSSSPPRGWDYGVSVSLCHSSLPCAVGPVFGWFSCPLSGLPGASMGRWSSGSSTLAGFHRYPPPWRGVFGFSNSNHPAQGFSGFTTPPTTAEGRGVPDFSEEFSGFLSSLGCLRDVFPSIAPLDVTLVENLLTNLSSALGRNGRCELAHINSANRGSQVTSFPLLLCHSLVFLCNTCDWDAASELSSSRSSGTNFLVHLSPDYATLSLLADPLSLHSKLFPLRPFPGCGCFFWVGPTSAPPSTVLAGVPDFLAGNLLPALDIPFPSLPSSYWDGYSFFGGGSTLPEHVPYSSIVAPPSGGGRLAA